MTPRNPQEPRIPEQPDELVERVVDAFESTELPPKPDPAETLRAIEPQLNGDASALRLVPSSTPAPASVPSNRWLIRRLGPLAAAALVLLALTVTLWLPGRFDSNAAFAQAVEQVRAAQTMAFTMTMAAPGQDVPMTMHAKVKNPGWMRVEASITVGEHTQHFVQVFDHEAQVMLMLMADQKLAQWIDMAGMPRGENPHDIVAEFRRLDPEQATYVRDEELDGVKAHLYEIHAGAIKGKTWIDAQTLHPLRMELGSPVQPDNPEATIVMEQFVWDIEVDDAIFDMTIPEGYTVREMDMSNAQPEDLAQMLRIYSTMSEAPFPENFGPETMAGLSGLMFDPELSPQENQGRLVRRLTPVYGAEALQDENLQATIEGMSETVGRGAIYMAILTEDAEDWQWVGGGVSAGDGSVPLCWWKPKDDETYRVIYNDFTVHEVTADDLPETPTDASE